MSINSISSHLASPNASLTSKPQANEEPGKKPFTRSATSMPSPHILGAAGPLGQPRVNIGLNGHPTHLVGMNRNGVASVVRGPQIAALVNRDKPRPETPVAGPGPHSPLSPTRTAAFVEAFRFYNHSIPSANVIGATGTAGNHQVHLETSNNLPTHRIRGFDINNQPVIEYNRPARSDRPDRPVRIGLGQG